jgi:hypothetical protein
MMRSTKTLDRYQNWPLKKMENLMNGHPVDVPGWGIVPEAVRDEFIKLFGRYRASGRNLKVMTGADPELAEILSEMLELRLVFGSSGFADVNIVTNQRYRPGNDRPSYAAAEIFSRLIISPHWSKLDGPCDECGKYFIRERRSFRKKIHVFCSRTCSGRFTARDGMAAFREAENAKKLDAALEAAARWKPNSGMFFKEFVRNQAKIRPKLTKTWVSQAVNQGKLKNPQHKESK